MPKDTGVRRLLVATTKLDRSSRTDRDLLRQFANCGDESAFEALVKRHTDLVLGVCRRSLPNGQDAEDACQAVFLILAQKANTERWQSSIANWLYATARKVSRNARLATERRVKREGQAGQAAVSKSVLPIDQMTGRELLAALDDEMERLPAIYREPLVLCHLEGLSRYEVATRLGVGPGTIKIRLERARKRLAGALTKRGIDVGAGLLALAATSSAEACSSRVIESILATAGGPPSAAVAAMARGIAVNGLLKTKLLALAAVAAAATGFGLASMQIAAVPQKPEIERTKQSATNDDGKSNDKPKSEQPAVKVNAPPKHQAIDPETIAAYEKLGAVYGVFPVGQHRFSPGKDAADPGLPGFRFSSLSHGGLPMLPPVQVPFGLYLGETDLVDAGLKELKDLKNLTTLILCYTKVTDTGLKELKALNNLSTLDLLGTKVTDAGLTEVKNLNNLTTLNLYFTQVTDAGLKELKELKSLTWLFLPGAQVTDAGLKELKSLSKLTTLILLGAQVTDAGLKELNDLNNLTVLDLQHTQVTDEGLKELSNLSKLTSLFLQSTQVKDLKGLGKLKNLTTLYLFDTPVTDAGLKELKDLQKLTTLSLFRTPVTDAGMKELKGLKNLVDLSLSGTQVTDVGLKEFKDIKSLTTLSLGEQVTGPGLKELKDLKNLASLRLDGRITGAGFKELQELKKLTELILREHVTDADLKELKKLKNLTSLYLYNAQVTDVGLKELRELKSLATLCLYDTQVTDAGLNDLKELKNLTYLDLTDTKVTDVGLKELQKALPRCTIKSGTEKKEPFHKEKKDEKSR